MIKRYSPDSEAELVLIKSLFDAEDIHYFVLNDHFGPLKVGPRIDLFNTKVIYVGEGTWKRRKRFCPASSLPNPPKANHL